MCGVGSAPAVDFYVDPVDGDDASNGLSWEAPLRTITGAARIGASDRFLTVYLSDGVFSRESGEVFPISFTYPPWLQGVSPERTIIDPGTSGTIIENSSASGDWVVLYGLTFLGHSMQTDMVDANPMINVRANDALIQRVNFEGFSSQTQFMLGSSLLYGFLYFQDCGFIECDARWFTLYDCYPDLLVHQCLFTGSSLTNDQDERFTPFHAELVDCRFSGPGSLEGFDSFGELAYINCEFEDFRLQILSGGSGSHGGYVYYYPRDLIGCSFKNSTIEINTHQNGPDFELCAFDPASELVITSGAAVLFFCCSSFVSNDHIYLSLPIEGTPLFVEGPLGGCYLSNTESGQWTSSPCVDIDTYERRDCWPAGSTTRTDGVPDQLPFDIGYHYPSVAPPPPAIWVETDRQDYAPGDEMTVSVGYENRGVRVEGAMYIAFGPESLDWLVYWPWMTFTPTSFAHGTFYSGLTYPNLGTTTHTIPPGLASGTYFWLAAVLNADASLASDLNVWPITIAGG